MLDAEGAKPNEKSCQASRNSVTGGGGGRWRAGRVEGEAETKPEFLSQARVTDLLAFQSVTLAKSLHFLSGSSVKWR